MEAKQIELCGIPSGNVTSSYNPNILEGIINRQRNTKQTGNVLSNNLWK